MGTQVDMGGDDVYVNNIYIGTAQPQNVGGPSQSLLTNSTNIAAANTTGFTATAAQVAGAAGDQYLLLTGTLGAGANLTLPTVATMAAVVPMIVGNSWTWTVTNASSAAFTWTIVTNTGWTTSGTLTVAQNTTRTFVIKVTGATTMTITSVQTATYS